MGLILEKLLFNICSLPFSFVSHADDNQLYLDAKPISILPLLYPTLLQFTLCPHCYDLCSKNAPIIIYHDYILSYFCQTAEQVSASLQRSHCTKRNEVEILT